MPFDNDLVLRDGTIDLDENEAAVLVVSLDEDVHKAKALDLKETGVKGLACVMVVPNYHATLDTEPIDYEDTLTVEVQVSDHLDRGWETLATFPVLNALIRKIKLVSTTVFTATDLSAGVIVLQTTLDAGIILAVDQSLFTLGGTGYILLAMDDVDSVFAYDSGNDALTNSGAGTGAGDLLENGVAVSTMGVSIVRFATDKRYVRTLNTVTSGGQFYGVQIMLTPYPFKTL